jgi:hypothetical protein
MTEDQLRSMSEHEIRARFRCAPAYYLQAKLEKKRTQRKADDRTAAEAESRWEAVLAEQSQWQAALPEPASGMPRESEALNLDLTGLDALDAALTESEPVESEPVNAAPVEDGTDAGNTQQTILEAALEDYSSWPVLSEPQAEAESAPESETELVRKLTLVLDSDLDLDLLLDAGPATAPKAESPPQAVAVVEPALELELELELILDSVPELNMELELEPSPEFAADNVTRADFGQRAPRTVPVVSVVMDRKRPNMVRVVGKSTRLAG